MRDLLERLLKASRHPLRLAATGAAALCLVWTFTDGFGRFAACFGAVAGVALGELLGRTRLRSGVLAAAAILAGLGLAAGQWIAVGLALLPAVLGPVAALHAEAVLSFGGVALLVAGLLRGLATRHNAAKVLELGALCSAVAFAFAAHRGGSIARPLWLSDRAWSWGVDPIAIVMGVGAALAALLVILLLLESRRRLPLLASAVLPVLALIAFLWTDPATLATPPQTSDLDDIRDGRVPSGGDAENDEWRSRGGGDGQREGQRGSGQASGLSGAGAGAQQGGQGGARFKPTGASGAQQGAQQGGRPMPGQPGDGQGGGGRPDLAPGESGGRPSPVAIVLLGDDYEPPSEMFYLRQEPHSQYNGKRLVKATRADVDQDALDHFATQREEVARPPGEERTPVQATISLLIPHDKPFGLEAPVAFYPTPNPNPGRFVRTYGVESLSQETRYERLLGRSVGDPSWTPEVWKHYTEGPPDPRYGELARDLIAQLPPEYAADPFAQALKIKLYLDENTKYTRRARHDDAADYLFGDFTGYCVHTAHAAVYLWRSVGIPARIGTGYLVDAADRRGSALMVTNRDGHAWPELYIEGLGWTVLDVSPATNLDQSGEPMDEDMLEALADLARDEFRPPDRDPIDYAGAWQSLLRGLKALGLAAVLLSVVGHYAVKVYRRLRPAFAAAHAQPRAAYRAALDALAEVGLARQEGETRERFAGRVAATVPGFSDLTSMHLAATLGAPGAARPSREQWRSALALVQRQRRASTRWWRRLLGLLDPLSIYRSR